MFHAGNAFVRNERARSLDQRVPVTLQPSADHGAPSAGCNVQQVIYGIRKETVTEMVLASGIPLRKAGAYRYCSTADRAA